MVITDDVEMEDTVKKVREQALKLGNDRVHLEEELKEWLSILTQNGVGTDEALVDADGYPRTDIDVYQVRQARHKVICIRNDLRYIMKEIEELLNIIHLESANTSSERMEFEIASSPPIAKVISVCANSPADKAGLKVNDLIIHFGSVCNSNLNSFADVKNLVEHSIDQFIKVVVRRNETIIKLRLKPHLWTGLGMLGCIIVRIENVQIEKLLRPTSKIAEQSNWVKFGQHPDVSCVSYSISKHWRKLRCCECQVQKFRERTLITDFSRKIIMGRRAR